MEQIDGKAAPLIIVYSQSEDVRTLLKTFLQIWKYQIVEAVTEADLIRLVKQMLPALILFDLSRMFDSDLDILRRLRTIDSCSKLPIIALSGHARRNDSVSAIASGVNEYLIKPLNFELLEHSIRKYSPDQSKDNFGGWQ